ncbi:MAG TPA: hypothetical protein DCS57_08730, partial [Dehalococcoidia bacterium]|nr:hypothetical protein [Dehalococcoidia bacterium]
MTDVLPTNIDEIVDMAEAVEDSGIDSVWVGDSLTAKPRLEPFTALSAIAAGTKNIRLGTAVLLSSLRHPVQLAHVATTLDLISEGRLVLGMGVGGAFNDAQRKEWHNVGVDPRKRAGRFEESLKIFKPLTRGETITFSGEHFDVRDISIKPVSPQNNGIPVLVAAHGRSKLERQYERVLLGDGIISISDFPDEYEMALKKVSQYCEQRGTQFKSLEKSFYMTVNIGDKKEKLTEEADRFLKLYYGINIWQERWGPWGTPEEVLTRIKTYENVGAETIIVRFASFDQARQL